MHSKQAVLCRHEIARSQREREKFIHADKGGGLLQSIETTISASQAISCQQLL